MLTTEKRVTERPPMEVRPPSPQPVATPPSSYNLAHIGAGGNAIAAAASQAIAATQQVRLFFRGIMRSSVARKQLCT